ncbi:MAG TPA: EthD family reductase [Solirubrobacterales bacterium]|nr:EthD family reductase [Solirubrobacterales bacterium]
MGSFKAISCWSFPPPGEEEAFERHYWEVHVPLAAAIPGTLSLTLTRTDHGLEDAPPSYYRVAETVFESEQALAAAMATPEWAALRADAAAMHERFGVTLANGLGTPHPVALAAQPSAPGSAVPYPHIAGQRNSGTGGEG